jgi:hypothetical protein
VERFGAAVPSPPRKVIPAFTSIPPPSTGWLETSRMPPSVVPVPNPREVEPVASLSDGCTAKSPSSGSPVPTTSFAARPRSVKPACASPPAPPWLVLTPGPMPSCSHRVTPNLR